MERYAWNPAALPMIETLEPWLPWTDDYRSDVDTLWIQWETLRRITLASAGKAAGVDDWAPAHWASLPPEFFHCLITIWDPILHGDRRIPKCWLDVQVVFIPNADLQELDPCLSHCWLGALGSLLFLGKWILSWMREEVID